MAMRARFLLLALLVGCAGKPAVAPTAPTEGVVAARLPVHLAPITGVAQAPASLLGNNSSGIVSNGGGSVVSNAGGTVISNAGAHYALAGAEAWQAVPGAQVVALDARRQPIPGVKPATTDASGHFKLENVPANKVVTVQITADSVTLTGLAKADGTSATVNPATTVATEHIRERFAGNEEALSHVPLEQFRQLTVSVQTAIQADDVKVPLATTEDAGKAFDVIAKTHTELVTQEQSVAQGAKEELAKAVEQGDNDPAPTPTPAAPTATPAAPAATPTPAPGEATPTPPAATPTPKPAGQDGNAQGDQGSSPAPRPSGDRPASSPTPAPAKGEAARNQLLNTKACPGCDLTNQGVYGKDLTGANLAGAKLRGLDAHGAKLVGANLAGADLTGADLHLADLTGANLRGANLHNADLHLANFQNADLTGATLDGAQLDLENAKLGGATWTDGSVCAAGSNGACNH